ncbi:Glycosyltransferase involved in cell wall bisynthesis [Flavobacterium micromati]|jgi:glycosyltransferase involved in cell wall biosynthesis|uniref:Glycosyltransferase involved in cell wall bisynthesis n=1 Tax=Flavobacterium micromati TaxID=229205 RepID=A0A1M5K7U8_9FLAO|nr:glycosyltransferase family 2 protein [Flavobacterium micromati]SHG48751.1 Glycosyltransferase involved in cell wall bisynthesis [Flavobacterium micromati]
MKISVVIPMYNSSKTILKTLNSVKNQTVLPFEVIIVNDGSTDNSLAIIENFVNENTFLNISIIDKKNGGVSTARNAGIKASKGNWIALLDSDDEWLSNKLQRQTEILSQNPQIDFLGTNRNGEYFSSILWKKLDLLTKISPKLLLVKFIFVVPTVIFRKSITDTIGFFDESQRYAEEGNYFIRIVQKYNCYLLNESLVLTGGGKAHFGHSGLSGNMKEMEKGELKNIRDSLALEIINIFEYLLLVVFSILKYFRRVIVVKFFR